MREFIAKFNRKFKDNCERSRELDATIMKDASFEEWKKLLLLRSQEIRNIFKENEELLQELSEYLKKPLDDVSAKDLYDGLAELYLEAYDDLYIMSAMAEPLIRFYEGKNDYEKIVFLNHIIGFENFEFYGRMQGDMQLSDAEKYYFRVVELRSHYAEMEDVEARKCIFKAYSNLVAPVGQVNPDVRKNIFQIFDEVIQFWKSDVVQSIDGENEEIIGCVEQIYDDILIMEEYTSEMSEEQKEHFKEIVSEIDQKYRNDKIEDITGNLRRAKQKCRLIDGENAQSIMDEMIDYLLHAPLPDYQGDEMDAMRITLDFHNTAISVFDLFKFAFFSPQERQEYLHRFYDRVTKMHLHIPHDFWTNMMNDFCAEWYKDVSPYLEDERENRELLLKLVVSRQPVTYIHCLMVEEIAGRITRSMLKHNPEYFLGIPGCESLSDVRDKKDEIMKYVADCSMLHDVGKCEIVEIINRQNRKLSDFEFSMIKRHPEKGPELLKYSKVYEPYYDVMLGHHKSYDGKTGYPEYFDNTKSPVKSVIDIVTIADCTDAATDVLGRNYAAGKDFSVLFEELKQGAGTRYSPAVVELIEKDRGLFEDLQYLTEAGRQSVYYKAYKEIVFL